jgi:glycogen operon protein
MGTEVRDGGVNFAVFSLHAERIELCLFDADGKTELQRYDLAGPDDGVFHGFLAGAGPGLIYGFRAHGVDDPQHGLRFNARHLLLDPNAREIVGRYQGDSQENAATALKARVAAPLSVAPGFLNAPRHAVADLVLYEVHVKGFSKTHPGIPAALQGTYAALAHPAAVAHFKSLGVTTLSLLPVQYCLDEPALTQRGQSNYWGYNTLGFCCPDPRLATQPDDPAAVTKEFRRMVEDLHAQGLEVVLDVVYNHTPEGNEHGPTLSFRGLDNATWYLLDPADRSRYENFSACGNTLNVAHPKVSQFVLDSLRYWVLQMGVDGFRFDLAPVLGRTEHGFDPSAPFLAALQQDPILARVHLIAEPWDSGPNGYQVGRFPGRFLDWNDRFRDAVRGYWLQRGVDRAEFARRMTASSDLFEHGQRRPSASINFLAVHDGFTLHDVVSYKHKHNQANGEDNRDGRDNELSGNFGVEGETGDAVVNSLRRRVWRAMLASLLLAQGTPMLCAGDEIGKTQQGNNNAYCQDNALGWLDWSRADYGLRDFVAELLALRRSQPVLRSNHWSSTTSFQPGAVQRIWRMPSGQEMMIHDWHDPGSAAFSCESFCSDAPSQGATGDRVVLVFNPESKPTSFTFSGQWQLLLDSSAELSPGLSASSCLLVPAHAVLVLRRSTI